MKILITEMILEQSLEELPPNCEVEYDPDLWQDRAVLLEKAADARALIVRNQTRVDEDLIAAAQKLEVIGRLGVGLDNIDLEAAKSGKITVVAAKNANAVSVAEYVIAAMLHVSRDISAANRDVRAGNWRRGRFTGSEVYGKTLGLVGVGQISQRVARRAKAMGMDVIGYDPFVASYDYPVTEIGVELTDLDSLLARSDFVSLHLPLTEAMKGLFDTSAFEKMKPDAWLINTARGGIVNESDLAAALDIGEIGGAVLDVLSTEPVAPENPLLARDAAIFTPHIAGLTRESQKNVSTLITREVANVLNGHPSNCVVG